MENRIEWILGNCIEKMQQIQSGTVDMILSDLPQNITKNKWDIIIPWEQLWKEYKRVTKENAAIVLFGNQPFTSELVNSNRKMFKYSLVWQKTTSTGFLNAKKMPLRSHEDICVFYRKPCIYNPQKTTGHPRKVSTATHKLNCKETENYGKHGLVTYDSTERYPTSVLKYKLDKQHSNLHSTQKPVALLEYLIRTYTNEDETVLDSTAGSASTVIAALNTNRRCIGIEKDESIYRIGKERIEKWRKEE